MEIEKLIEAFQLAIPTYQKAVDEKWDWYKISKNDMERGLCLYMQKYNKYNKSIKYVFAEYYINYLNKYSYLFPIYIRKYSISESIKPRLDFMKREVKDLKKLMKKGYTHV